MKGDIMKRRKMSIDQYLDQEFVPGSQPCRKTVVNWIKAGVVDGVELGGKYWVYEKITEVDMMVAHALQRTGT